MGEFTNGRPYNLVSWATAVALVALTALMVVTSLLPRAR
jgi:Mn2+/Fe2+ NRAMP family transporter